MSMIDARVGPDEQEEITPGEAVAGMILNGLGFSNRPLSWTPQFFAHKPLALLLREGVRAEMVTRFTLGRTLDEAQAYGCDLLLRALALAVWLQEGLDRRCNHLATTSFSLSGEEVPDSDAQARTMTHGYSTDHRQDLQPAVLALRVSQDGGVPLVSQSWKGNASDTQSFQERAEALMAASQLSAANHAATLRRCGFLTRIPATRQLVAQVITQALAWDTWQRRAATTRYQRLELCHSGMAQRWVVVSSQAALERAESSVHQAGQRASDVIATALLHLQARRFETPEAAHAALAALATSWQDHQREPTRLIEHNQSACKGRPTPTTPLKSIAWQRYAQVRPDQERLAYRQHQEAGCGIGTNIDANQVGDAEVVHAYKAQAQAEGGLRFLQDPLGFVSSLFVKKPSRLQGLLRVMT